MWNTEPNLQHGLSVKPISLKYNIPSFHDILSQNGHIQYMVLQVLRASLSM